MEDQISNNQVDITDLPSITTLNLIGLHKDYLTAKMIANAIFWSVIILAASTFLFLTKDEDFPVDFQLILPIVLGVFVISRFIMLYLGFKRKKYALRERDILYMTGLLWRSNTVIPFNRIQHAEVTQGPIERMFDLSVLRIFTAGGSSSDMSIPGLRPKAANDIKEYILGKTATDEEE